MPKYSQLPDIQAVITSDLLTVLHQGQVFKISKQHLFAGYLTEAQINQKIENVIGGGIPWNLEIQPGVTIMEGLQHYPHNLGKKEFLFQCEDQYGRPITPEIKAKTDTFISLFTSEEIANCTLYFFG